MILSRGEHVFPATDRRGILRAGLAAGLPLGLAACGARSANCGGEGWSIARIESGKFFDCFQSSVLSDVAELIIGTGERPSVSEANVLGTIDAMIDEWAGPTLKAGLSRLPGQIDQAAIDRFDQSYANLPEDRRFAVLEAYDRQAFDDPGTTANTAYLEFKRMLLKIYTTSAQANSEYVRIPGAYLGDLSRDEYVALLRERAENFSG